MTCGSARIETTTQISPMNQRRRFFTVLLVLNAVISATIAESDEGKSCRMEKISVLHENDPPGETRTKESILNEKFRMKKQDHQAVALDMTLYNKILFGCSLWIEQYNKGAAEMCLNEVSDFIELWAIGPINMDAEWILTADIMLSNNFQDSPNPLIPCSDYCYNLYEEECQAELRSTGQDFLNSKFVNSVSSRQQTVGYSTDLLGVDNMYQNLRQCAANYNHQRFMFATNDTAPSDSVIEHAAQLAAKYSQQGKTRRACGAYTEEPTLYPDATLAPDPTLAPTPFSGSDDAVETMVTFVSLLIATGVAIY